MKNTFPLNVAIYLFMAHVFAHGEPIRLSDRTAEDAHSLIARGGESLIELHGEELLELLYFRPQPTDEELLEATSDPPLLKPRKEDLPVYRAFLNESEASLQLLRSADYFKYPQHPADLEVIAYLILDILGHDDASNFVEDRLKEGMGYATYNWDVIKGMLEKPELASGRFIVGKAEKGSLAGPAPTTEQLREERMQLKNLLTTMPPDDVTGFLSVHLRFRTILGACLQHRSTKEHWPASLLSVVDDGNLKKSDILFKDLGGFLYVPRIKMAVEDDSQESVLELVTPDGKFTIRGFLDGTIDVVHVDRK